MSRQNRQPLWRQRTWVAFAIFALLLFVSTAVSAQTTTTKTNETTEFDETIKNPCNDDFANIHGKQHMVVSQQDQANQRVKIQSRTDRHGTGEGTIPFGTPPQFLKYSYGQKSSLNLIAPAPTDPSAPTFTERTRTRMISQGASPSPDNFHATFVTAVHRNGNTKTTMESDCRGQGREPRPL